jgi:hypothetical protein
MADLSSGRSCRFKRDDPQVNINKLHPRATWFALLNNAMVMWAWNLAHINISASPGIVQTGCSLDFDIVTQSWIGPGPYCEKLLVNDALVTPIIWVNPPMPPSRWHYSAVQLRRCWDTSIVSISRVALPFNGSCSIRATPTHVYR